MKGLLYNMLITLAMVAFGIGMFLHESNQDRRITQANERIPITHTVEVDREYDAEAFHDCVIHATEIALNSNPYFERNEELILKAFDDCVN